jgi:hypothetical protein
LIGGCVRTEEYDIQLSDDDLKRRSKSSERNNSTCSQPDSDFINTHIPLDDISTILEKKIPHLLKITPFQPRPRTMNPPTITTQPSTATVPLRHRREEGVSNNREIFGRRKPFYAIDFLKSHGSHQNNLRWCWTFLISLLCLWLLVFFYDTPICVLDTLSDPRSMSITFCNLATVIP